MRLKLTSWHLIVNLKFDRILPSQGEGAYLLSDILLYSVLYMNMKFQCLMAKTNIFSLVSIAFVGSEIEVRIWC